MRNHYGYIDIRRGVTGSIFELYFPVIAQQESLIQESTSLETMLGKGEIITSVLNRLGYQTASVACGEKAIEYIKNNSVDLILLDMVMPPGKKHPGRNSKNRVKLYQSTKIILISRSHSHNIDIVITEI